MKWPLAALALATAAPGLACAPSLGNEPPRSYYVRQAAAAAPDIVYAMVEREMPAPRARGGELRRLRILHVYKGDLRVGQRLTMHVSDSSTMCDPKPPARMQAPRGAYGVLLLYRPVGDAPPPFPDFLWPTDVEDLIQAGLIPSARR